MAEGSPIRRVATGTFRVDEAGRSETIYVAGPASDRWAFWNGHVFRTGENDETRDGRQTATRTSAAQRLSAPMPATVTRILVTAGSHINKGDTVLVLEAMKMELPVRSMGAGTVKAVRCREGDLVTADQTLVELE
jgi:3-methylcrotonyl-CoA carboxylase alpha subunit